MKNKYTATIGIECHVQLKTVSKLFSAAGNDARYSAANTLINHIDFGLPGALPVFNKQALALATQAAIALKTKPQLFSTFDRKHYFYPDLPMGYQITQYDKPIILGGEVVYLVNGVVKKVGITRAHLESDAGKSTHPVHQNYSLVDLNRAGTPLLEIVSEPDMHSALEAKLYAKELYLLMRYADITEGDLFHGNMRFDVNVSISDSSMLGTRSETKNLNSFRSVEKAVEYEIKRQTDLLSRGERVVQETRGWNEAKQKTISQRNKENADDYRYMPDPDLPPLIIDNKYIAQIKKTMPLGLNYWRDKLKSLDLSIGQIDTLIEANLDIAEANYLKLILDFNQSLKDAKQVANWLVNIDIPLMKSLTDRLSPNRPVIYQKLIELVSQRQLSSTNTKELLSHLLLLAKLPPNIKQFAKDNNLLQQSDQATLETIVDQVIQHNPEVIADVLSGKDKAIGYLVGQVMQLSKGQANPSIVKDLLTKKLSAKA